jgi:hypothetical protein
MRTIATLSAAVALGLAVPALAQTTTTASSGAAKMNRADCTGAWTKLDASKTGSVSQSQAQGVVTDFKARTCRVPTLPTAQISIPTDPETIQFDNTC